MDKILLTIVMLLFAEFCVSNELEYCDVSSNQKILLEEKLKAFIQSKTTEHETYTLSPLFVKEGKLIKGNSGCYTVLPVKPVNHDCCILDGSGPIFVYPDTLDSEPNFWFKYDPLPTKVPIPRYPREARSACIDGYAVVEFTVTKKGKTKDTILIEEWPEGWGFGVSAKRASKSMKYELSVRDGGVVEIPGMLYKFIFLQPC